MSNRLSSGTRVNQWGPIGSPNGMGKRFSSKATRPSHQSSKWGVGGKMPETRNGDARRRKVMTITREGMHNQEQFYSPPAIANPGNVIRCKVGGGLMGSRLAHENEAPFPEAMAEFFIRSFCPPGGRVLDPFSGSGTTAAVALRCGRHAIASDIRQSQCDLTRRRIAEAQSKAMAEAVGMEPETVKREIMEDRAALAAVIGGDA